jgi:hypothetical protein
MNNVALLSMSTDGRITPEAWALAAARDRAEQVAAVRVMLPRIGKVTLKPEVIIRIMAKVIRQAAPARAAVHLRDFEQAGIGEADAKRYFAQALARARTLDASIDNAVEVA